MSNLSELIAITFNDESCRPHAEKISQTLHLKFADEKNLTPFLLVVTPTHLQLQKTASSLGPLQIDFTQGTIHYRLQNKQQAELIKKAVGCKTGKTLFVIDATAGLAQDGFILANLGCRVLLLERSPLIALLLEEALQQALAMPRYAQLQIQLKLIDAKEYLSQLVPENFPDVIYLDPMYPARNKSALVKKEMQYLQALIGKDEDATQLLEIALLRAKKRVVVKRPRLAEPLANKKPDVVFTGKNSRFDVYMSSHPELLLGHPERSEGSQPADGDPSLRSG